MNPEKRTQGTGHRQVKENFINLAVQKCGPAVVRIQTEQKVEVPALSTRFVKLKTEAVFLSIAMGWLIDWLIYLFIYLFICWFNI